MPSLAEIVLLAGQQRAESLRRLSDIDYNRSAQRNALWMNLGTNLAQLGANTFTSYRQQKAAQAEALENKRRYEQGRIDQAPLTAAQLEQAKLQAEGTRLQNQEAFKKVTDRENVEMLRRMSTSPGTGGRVDFDVSKIPGAVGTEHYDTLMKQIGGTNEVAAKIEQQHWNQAADLAYSVWQRGGTSQAYEDVTNEALQTHRLTPEAHQQLMAAPHDDVHVQQYMKDLLGRSDQPKHQELFKTFTVRPGEQVRTQIGGDKPVASAPIPEDKVFSVDPLHPSSGVKQIGSIGASDRLVQQQQPSAFTVGQAMFNQAPTEVNAARPDPTTANIPDRQTRLTPNQLYQGALTFALKGTLPAGSRSQAAMPAQLAIQAKAAAIAAAAGVDLALVNQEFTAATASTRALTSRYQFAAAASQAANDNIAYALELSPTVARTGAPMVNRFTQWLTSEMGGKALPDLSRFEIAVYTAGREYAKVASNASASIAELSATAAAKVDQLINAAQTPQQFKAVTEAMQRDMVNITKPLFDTIQNVNDAGPNLKQFLGFVGGRSGGQTPAAAPGGGGTPYTGEVRYDAAGNAWGQVNGQTVALGGSAGKWIVR